MTKTRRPLSRYLRGLPVFSSVAVSEDPPAGQDYRRDREGDEDYEGGEEGGDLISRGKLEQVLNPKPLDHGRTPFPGGAGPLTLRGFQTIPSLQNRHGPRCPQRRAVPPQDPLHALTLTGQYLGDLTSFVYRRVQAEADALFANGDPTGDDLTQSLSQRIKFLIKEKRHELPA